MSSASRRRAARGVAPRDGPLGGSGAAGRGRDVILTGVPRSGTTLACHLLNRLPDVVALHEPVPLSQLRGRGLRRSLRPERLADRLDAFLARTRASLLRDGTAPSKQRDGRVPDNPVADAGGRPRAGHASLRRGQVEPGLLQLGDKPLSPDFLLCAKHPSLYTALLPELARRHPVYAFVRNPLATLASWNTVAFPVSRGHARAAERLDRRLARTLARIPDTTARQLALLDWFCRRLRDHLPEEQILRYEDVVASKGTNLGIITGRAIPPPADPLHGDRNLAYDPALVRRLAERLLATEGAWWDFYPRAAVQELLRACEAQAAPGEQAEREIGELEPVDLAAGPPPLPHPARPG